MTILHTTKRGRDFRKLVLRKIKLLPTKQNQRDQRDQRERPKEKTQKTKRDKTKDKERERASMQTKRKRSCTKLSYRGTVHLSLYD